MVLNSNIKDVALILEGGGMRASYTSGVVSVLLKHQLYFDFVSGISAGSGLGVNYMARDDKRSYKMFVEIVNDPKMGGITSFLKGGGYFNSDYLYSEVCKKGNFLELDYDSFINNKATFMVGAVNAATGKIKYFSNKDMYPQPNLNKIIRASSSMPVLMPSTKIGDEIFYDGGIAGGIPLDIAKEHGYKKFFIILTRPKGYKKSQPKFPIFLRMSFRKYPKIFTALMKRAENYNKTLDEIYELERKGQAFVVYSEKMDIENTELNIDKLKKSFDNGYKQATRDIMEYKKFLGIEK